MTLGDLVLTFIYAFLMGHLATWVIRLFGGKQAARSIITCFVVGILVAISCAIGSMAFYQTHGLEFSNTKMVIFFGLPLLAGFPGWWLYWMFS